MNIRVAVAVVCCLLALGGGASFFVSPADSAPGPTEFDRTVAIGLTLEEQRGVADEQFLPRAQVAYSQYPYIVGYRGLGTAANDVDDSLVRQQFGYPQAVHIETVPDDVDIDDDGALVAAGFGRWTPADETFFAVNTGAETPSGPTPVPFADRADAEAFVTEHGGEIRTWDDRATFAASDPGGEAAKERVDRQQRLADENVSAAMELLDRPVEIVVGDDEPTLQDAIDAAPAGTAIELPPGTYDGPVEIDRPVTLVGENATVVGDGNSTVITIEADEVAVSGLSIAGIGDSLRADEVDAEGWDRRTEEAYGYSDAGITVAEADRILVEGVDMETPASGVVFRDSAESVVANSSVDGTEEWADGFMGVVAMRSPLVVQDSTFTEGRDGVYTHRAEGVTVRDNHFVEGRFGVHLMYTSDALVDNNCAVSQELSGVVVMTSPAGTAITNNVVVDTAQGVPTSGSDAYIGGNVIADTEQALSTSARNSLYTENTIVGNEVGMRASSVFPTSTVVRNDFADNDRHVRATTGPLRVWSDGDEGNYWEGAAGLDRRYTPTDPVDERLHRTDAARTLSDAPVVRGLRTLRGSVPGMRGESVVDAAPRSHPVDETRIETARALADGTATAEEVCGV